MAVGIQEPPRAFQLSPEIMPDERIERAGPGTSEADRLYRLDPAQVKEMTKLGILDENAPLVLLDGLLVIKMTRDDSHVTATRLLEKAFNRILPDGWMVGREDPIVLKDGPSGYSSLPEPDISVFRGEIRDYTRRTPSPAEIALLAEISNTSLAKDRKALARYAWCRIPTVWIVILASRTVEVYTDPTGPGDDPRYGSCRTIGEDAEIPVVLDGVEVGRIAVAAILP